jgi:hypothetical protein
MFVLLVDLYQRNPPKALLYGAIGIAMTACAFVAALISDKSHGK